MKPLLSKTRIQNGRQCDKRLWLDVHNPKPAVWSDEAQARLDEGTLFEGNRARSARRWRAGEGEDIVKEVEKALDDTEGLLAQSWSKAPMLFEPAFSTSRTCVFAWTPINAVRAVTP